MLILRPGVGYQLLDQLSVYAGYAWVPTFEDEGANRHEHRSWQQLLFNARASQAWAFALRPRFEQRFAEGGNETGYRVRLLARTTYTTPAGVLLVVWDEFFYQANDTDWGAVAGFDQNRAFAGIGLLAINDVRIELGYLNVFTKRKPDSNLAHNLAVNLFWTY